LTVAPEAGYGPDPAQGCAVGWNVDKDVPMTAAPPSFVRRDAAPGSEGPSAAWPRLAVGTERESGPESSASGRSASEFVSAASAVPAAGIVPPPSVAPASAIAAPLCWTLTEGAAGMVSQVRGLAAAVGYPTVHHQVVLRWPFSTMWPGFIPPWNGVFADRRLVEPEVPPQLVISCGRQAIVAARALKRRLGRRLFTVHIQDPKLPARLFDLIVTPAHDALLAPNVVQSLGAVHHVTQQRLREAAERGPTPEMRILGREPFVGVLLGGPNKYYSYCESDITRLIDRLRGLESRPGVRLAIVPSRRTPEAALQRLQAAFGARQFVWDGRGENPYLAILALASHLVVTGDSVSMVSEAAATQKPLYVFHLTERRRARRFRSFHESFVRAGITRPLEGELDSWTYASPDRTGLIATLIREHLRAIEPAGMPTRGG